MDLDYDLKEVLNELKDISKIYQTSIKDCNEYKTKLKILTNMLKASEESEENVRLKQQKCQKNLMELQNILNGYININEENETLRIEIKKTKDLLELERTNYSIEKDKWLLEKETLMKNYSAEIQNLKTLRNMEVSSLNREIDSIREENDRKIEKMKNAIENDYKNQLSRTKINNNSDNGILLRGGELIPYTKLPAPRCCRSVRQLGALDGGHCGLWLHEESMAKLSIELISAQTQLNNLRQANEDNVFNEENKRERSSYRYIPQPLSYGRYRPLIPIVSTASQMSKTPDGPEVEKSSNTEVKINSECPKKKRKLFTWTDDLL